MGRDARQPRARLGEGNGIDGAHILTPMPYLISRRQGDAEQRSRRRCTSWRGSTSTASASRSRKEYADLKVGVDTKPFKAALEKKKASGKSVKAAMTFPGGTHDLWIRYWLAAGGIDPDKDIETIVVPPRADGGEHEGRHHGLLLRRASRGTSSSSTRTSATPRITTGELWNKHPEKSLGMRAAWVDKYPNAAKALLMAVMEAQQWCDKMENREELAAICAKRQWINVPGRRHHRPHARASSTTASGKVVEKLAAHHEVLDGPRVLSVPEPRPLVHHRGHPLGQVRAQLSTPRR